MSVCLSASAYLHLCLSVRLTVCFWFCLFLSVSPCLSIYLNLSVCLCISTGMSVCLFMYVCLPVLGPPYTLFVVCLSVSVRPTLHSLCKHSPGRLGHLSCQQPDACWLPPCKGHTIKSEVRGQVTQCDQLLLGRFYFEVRSLLIGWFNYKVTSLSVTNSYQEVQFGGQVTQCYQLLEVQIWG